eukprot:scaffold80583_cov72-Phaeocystis_antarctica.AAC.1
MRRLSGRRRRARCGPIGLGPANGLRDCVPIVGSTRVLDYLPIGRERRRRRRRHRLCSCCSCLRAARLAARRKH